MPKKTTMTLPEYSKLCGFKNQRYPSAMCKSGTPEKLKGVKSARLVKPRAGLHYWLLTMTSDYETILNIKKP